MVMVSVIIPVYNMEGYIKECLDSVLKQTLKELEVVCVDDGSTDGSLCILKDYQHVDARVRVLTQENQGSGPARNRGMEEARGKYVAFLDADDFWHDDSVLGKIVQAAEENAASVTGAFWGNYKDGRYERAELHSEYFQDGETGRWIAFREEQDCIGYCSYLFQREFLRSNDITFPAYYRFQDPPFLVRVLVKAEKYYVVPVDWHCYRTVYKNVLPTSRKTADFVRGVVDILEIAEKHRLEKLSGEMVRQINEFSQCIISGIMRGNTEMLLLLGRVQKYTAGRKEDIEPVRFLGDAVREKCETTADGFWRRIRNADKLVIYGAGKYGHFLLDWIEKMGIDTEIIFAETAMPTKNTVGGRKCVQIDQMAEDRENVPVIIAVTPKTQPELAENLRRLGFKNYIFLDRDLMTALECTYQNV